MTMASGTTAIDVEKLRDRLRFEIMSRSLEGIRSILSGLSFDVATAVLNTPIQHSRGFYRALTLAAYLWDSATVQLLLEDFKVDVDQRASVDVFEGKEMTSLMLAAKSGNIGIVKLLVAAGCDLQATDFNGQTAVQWAVQKKKFAVLEYLVECGADITLPNSKGTTCLFDACLPGQDQIVTFLLEKGADPNAEVTLNLAAGSFEEWKDLFVSQKMPIGESKIHPGAPRADVHVREWHTTALHRAAATDAPGVLRHLLKHGAKLVVDGDGRTPLDIAMARHFRNVVGIFIDSIPLSRQQKISACDWMGSRDSLSAVLRYLRMANEERQKDIADLSSNSCSIHPPESSLDDGKRADQVSRDLYSFLRHFKAHTIHQTLAFSSYRVVLEFCILKAEHNEKLHGVALQNTDEFPSYCLQAFLLSLRVAADIAEERQLVELVCRLLRLDPPASNGRSILHVALYDLKNDLHCKALNLVSRYDLLVTLLVKCGASVHARDNNGNRPLHVAAFCPNRSDCDEMLTSVTTTLLQADAVVGVRNKAGKTPLECAINTTVAEILRPHFPVSLTSLCATEVRRNEIPFEEEIPRHLVDFVQHH